jgi:hypothetical protein
MSPSTKSTDQEQATQYDYEFAPAWLPKTGQVLEGNIANIDTGASQYGAYPIVTVENAQGEKFAVHCFHTAIRGQLARVRPKVGDPIGIKYMGKKQSTTNSDRTYDVYRVISQGAGGYDWSQEADARVPDDSDLPY